MSGYGSVTASGGTLALTGIAHGQWLVLLAALMTILGIALILRMTFRRGKTAGDA